MSIKFNRAALLLALSLACLICSPLSLAKGEGDLRVVWERVVGITPVANLNSQFIEGIAPVGFPWTVERGRAQVNLDNGRFRFLLHGLAIGAMPTWLSPLGTTGIVTAVRGTLVCTGGGPVIDTEAVALSATGDAHLQGRLEGDFDLCNPADAVFLVRVAEVVPGAPDIAGSWLAYGAARRVQGLDP